MKIEDRLLAPISIKGVAIEKIIVGIIQAVMAGLFVLPLAWVMMRSGLDLRAGNLLLLLSVALLTSWLFAALGMVVGTVVAPQQIGLIFNVLIGPMIFFGCAYYPWAALKVIPWFSEAGARQSAGICERGVSGIANTAITPHALMADSQRADRLLRFAYLCWAEQL